MKDEDRNLIKDLRTLTGLSENNLVSVFKHLAFMCSISSYYNEEEVVIPYFGTFNLKFEGDDDERNAKVSGKVALHKDFKKNVGIIEDFKRTGNEDLLLTLDSFDMLEKDVKQSLKLINES